MQTFNFTHHLTCSPQHLEQTVQAILHTICFHRFLGTVKPAYVQLFGLTFPAIADSQTDQMIRQRSAEIVEACAAGKSGTLIVIFLDPSSKPIPKDGDTAQAGDKAATFPRSWTATTRSYQYGWLAQAFSSGAGQPSATFTAQPATPDDVGTGAFERWSITFDLIPGGEEGGAQRELVAFVDTVLRFVEENKAHLPAIGGAGAGLCTFPMDVVVRSGVE